MKTLIKLIFFLTLTSQINLFAQIVRNGGFETVTNTNIINTACSDYVFNEEYQRMSSEEKEKFVKQYKHLPNIAGEKEIISKGLNIGGTIDGIIKNTEENTLDVIDLYKLIKEQKEILKAQQLKIEELEKLLKK